MARDTASEGLALVGAEAYVKVHMAKYDPSHDWQHVNRVRNTALRIAHTLSPKPDLLLTELTALAHDLDDHKYSTAPLSATLRSISDSSSVPIPEEYIQKIIKIVPLVSWSTEKKLRSKGEWDGLMEGLGEEDRNVLFCVQDADRLDAIGAFGIMRCAAYSAAVNRSLHVPASSTKEEIDNTAIQHFYDKLLLIRERLKTDMGKSEAEKRHQTMLAFLEAIKDEAGES